MPDKKRPVNMSRIMAFFHFDTTDTLSIAAKIYTQHSLIIVRLSDILRQYLQGQILSFYFLVSFYSIVTDYLSDISYHFHPTYVHTTTTLVQQRCYIPIIPTNIPFFYLSLFLSIPFFFIPVQFSVITY
jgi:hypothetical protein